MSDAEHPCSVCGREMRDKRTGSRYSGMEITVTDLNGAFARLYPGVPTYFAVCYVCLLKALGWRVP